MSKREGHSCQVACAEQSCVWGELGTRGRPPPLSQVPGFRRAHGWSPGRALPLVEAWPAFRTQAKRFTCLTGAHRRSHQGTAVPHFTDGNTGSGEANGVSQGLERLTCGVRADAQTVLGASWSRSPSPHTEAGAQQRPRGRTGRGIAGSELPSPSLHVAPSRVGGVCHGCVGAQELWVPRHQPPGVCGSQVLLFRHDRQRALVLLPNLCGR